MAMAQAIERRLLEDTLVRLERSSGFSVLFGGIPSSQVIDVCTFRGNRGSLLGTLRVGAGRGLGGRAFAERRPRIAPDYVNAQHITHDYDREILSESIRTLIAVPVLVDGRVRSVIYGGMRDDVDVGGLAVQPVLRAAAELAGELKMQDRVRSIEAEAMSDAGSTPTVAISTAQLEELRASYADVRAIASGVDDPLLLEKLRRLEQRIVRLTSPEQVDDDGVKLSPRETDVLVIAATGSTTAEIAHELGLRESTVKSYIATGMRKLGARTRHEAVAEARKRGLLP